MFSETQIEEIIELLSNLSTDTKLYLGCDSKKFKKQGKWFAKYATVLIVHMNGSNGCKIFRNISTEPDYDKTKNRPSMRLMNEVYKVTELYLQLYPFIDQYNIEVHLDVNPDPKFGSSCVATQAAGYVLGVIGIEPKLKPHSFAASFGADGIVGGLHERSKTPLKTKSNNKNKRKVKSR